MAIHNMPLNLCRICFQDIQQFSCNEKYERIQEKIFLCSQISLKEYPNMCYLCSDCYQELSIAYNFRLKCLSSDDKLEKLLKKQSVVKDLSPHYNGETAVIKKGPGNDDDDVASDFCLENSSIASQVIPAQNLNEVEIKIEPFHSFAANTQLFKCDICNKILKSEASLLRHKIGMHQNRKHSGHVTGFGATRCYHCTQCSYSTPHSQTLVNHMRKHSGERPYHCPCGKTFTQSSSLATHSKTHSDITYYTCSICGKQFKHAFALKNHLRVHEDGAFSCHVCQKQLKSKESLQAHIHRHNNVRNYNCEECGATFVTSAELTNHKKKHNSKKRFQCHLCGYKTQTKKVLILHLKRHAGDKPFKCDSCDMSCYTAGELRTHRRVHTREKPYRCPSCAQRFTHSTSVNKHMRNLHGVHYQWGDARLKRLRVDNTDDKC